MTVIARDLSIVRCRPPCGDRTVLVLLGCFVRVLGSVLKQYTVSLGVSECVAFDTIVVHDPTHRAAPIRC